MFKRLIYVLGIGVALACVALVLPTDDLEAAGANEVEINMYSCPQNPTSLAQCTWNGMRLRDCSGNLMTEGTLTGNYKVVHSEACNTGHISTDCWLVGEPCDCLV